MAAEGIPHDPRARRELTKLLKSVERASFSGPKFLTAVPSTDEELLFKQYGAECVYAGLINRPFEQYRFGLSSIREYKNSLGTFVNWADYTNKDDPILHIIAGTAILGDNLVYSICVGRTSLSLNSILNAVRDNGPGLARFAMDPAEVSRGEALWDTKSKAWVAAEFGPPPSVLLSRATSAFLFLQGCLNTPSIEREHVAANSKAVRAAQKAGQAAPPTFIRLTNFGTIEGSGQYASAKRCMHWRRGHFRELPSGKVVPVAPCIVNKVEGVVPEHRDYDMSAISAKPLAAHL